MADVVHDVLESVSEAKTDVRILEVRRMLIEVLALEFGHFGRHFQPVQRARDP